MPVACRKSHEVVGDEFVDLLFFHVAAEGEDYFYRAAMGRGHISREETMVTDSLNRNRVDHRTTLGGLLVGAASLSALDRRVEAADANLAAIDPQGPHRDHDISGKQNTFYDRPIFAHTHSALRRPSLTGRGDS